jgi:excisionase family DNA binding protein
VGEVTGAREQLEDAAREQLNKAYIHGVLLARRDEMVPLTYPEADEAVAVVMAAAGACADDGEGSGSTALDGVRFLTVAEIARAARVSGMTVYRAVEAGELRAARIGRVYRVLERDALRYLGIGGEAGDDGD